MAFGSQHDDAIHSIVKFVIAAIAALVETNDPETALLHFLKCACQVDYACDVHVLGSSSRCLCHRWINSRSPAFRNHNSICSGSISGADQCAEVMGILYSIEHDDKAVLSFFMSEDFIQFGVVFAGYDRDYSLMRLGSCETVELFARYEAQRDALFSRQIDHRLQSLIVTLARDFHMIERPAARKQSLFHGMDSVENVHGNEFTACQSARQRAA